MNLRPSNVPGDKAQYSSCPVLDGILLMAGDRVVRHGRAKGLVVTHLPDGLGQGLHVIGIDSDRVVLVEDVVIEGSVRRYDGQPHGQSLDHGITTTLLLRGQHKDVCATHILRYQVVVERSFVDDAWAVEIVSITGERL